MYTAVPSVRSFVTARQRSLEDFKQVVIFNERPELARYLGFFIQKNLRYSEEEIAHIYGVTNEQVYRGISNIQQMLDAIPGFKDHFKQDSRQYINQLTAIYNAATERFSGNTFVKLQIVPLEAELIRKLSRNFKDAVNALDKQLSVRNLEFFIKHMEGDSTKDIAKHYRTPESLIQLAIDQGSQTLNQIDPDLHVCTTDAGLRENTLTTKFRNELSRRILQRKEHFAER